MARRSYYDLPIWYLQCRSRICAIYRLKASRRQFWYSSFHLMTVIEDDYPVQIRRLNRHVRSPHLQNLITSRALCRDFFFTIDFPSRAWVRQNIAKTVICSLTRQRISREIPISSMAVHQERRSYHELGICFNSLPEHMLPHLKNCSCYILVDYNAFPSGS